MKKSLITAVLAGLAFVLAGVAALAGATSVSTKPEPAFITRSAPTTTSTTPTGPITHDRVDVPTTTDDHGHDTSGTVDDHGRDGRRSGSGRGSSDG